MGPEAIWLEVLNGGREGTYRFTCPTCMDAVEKRADRKIVALLVSAGVDPAGSVPAEDEELAPDVPATVPLPAADRPPDGPPLSVDDVIDFHFRLLDDGYIESFLTSR
jgi:hypothetical protein